MPYVPVPKDLTKVKTKVAFNLTKRQLIDVYKRQIYGRMIEVYRASRSAAFHPQAVCGHFGNPALASRYRKVSKT